MRAAAGGPRCLLRAWLASSLVATGPQLVFARVANLSGGAGWSQTWSTKVWQWSGACRGLWTATRLRATIFVIGKKTGVVTSHLESNLARWQEPAWLQDTIWNGPWPVDMFTLTAHCLQRQINKRPAEKMVAKVGCPQECGVHPTLCSHSRVDHVEWGTPAAPIAKG